MLKTAGFVFIGHAYALVLSGWLLSLSAGFAGWFANLPWMYWGTDLLESVVYLQAPEPGSVWLGLFVLQIVVGFLWMLSWAIFEIMALIYNAAVKRVESERVVQEPTCPPHTQSVLGPKSVQPASIDELVQDPEIQQLMRDLETRLSA